MSMLFLVHLFRQLFHLFLLFLSFDMNRIRHMYTHRPEIRNRPRTSVTLSRSSRQRQRILPLQRSLSISIQTQLIDTRIGL